MYRTICFEPGTQGWIAHRQPSSVTQLRVPRHALEEAGISDVSAETGSAMKTIRPSLSKMSLNVIPGRDLRKIYTGSYFYRAKSVPLPANSYGAFLNYHLPRLPVTDHLSHRVFNCHWYLHQSTQLSICLLQCRFKDPKPLQHRFHFGYDPSSVSNTSF